MTTMRITENRRGRRRERRALGERDRVLRVAGDLARAQPVQPVVDLLAHLDLLEPVVVEPRLQAVDVQLGRGLALPVLLGDVLVDAICGACAPARTATAPIAMRSADDDGEEDREHDETDGARGTSRRVRSRTSGLSVNAITLAVRKRKRTWPSVDASRNARSSATGRTTSWIHRGIWIVGPEPAIARIVPRSLESARRRPCYGPAMATPRSRHAARLRADRRRCAGPARGDSPLAGVIVRARGRDARSDRVRQPERTSPVRSAGPLRAPVTSGAAGCRRCWRPSATFASSHPSRRAASPRSASTGARTARSS